MKIIVDDLDTGRDLEIACGDVLLALGGQIQGLRLVDSMPEHDLLEVQDEVDDVFDDALDGGELVLDTLDPHGRDGGTGNPGQQGAAQGVAERVAETRLERLDDEPRADVGDSLFFDCVDAGR